MHGICGFKLSCRPLLLFSRQGLEDQESLELAALCAGLAAAEVWAMTRKGRGPVCF